MGYYYQRLRELREDRGMVINEVASILSTSKKQYSKWETGEREIPVHHMITLANFYNTSVDYILGRTDDI